MCRAADDYNNVEPQHQCGVRHVPTGLHLSGIALPGEPQEIPMQADVLGILGNGIAVTSQGIITRVMKRRRLMTGMGRIGEVGRIGESGKFGNKPGTPRAAVASLDLPTNRRNVLERRHHRDPQMSHRRPHRHLLMGAPQ